MTTIIAKVFNEKQFSFRDDGWFNATIAASTFGKRPVDWLNQTDTAEYLSALYKRHIGNCDFVEQFNKIIELKNSSARQTKLLNLAKKTGYVKTKAGAQEIGGGTWLHPKLAVPFARWLDMDFSIWCDEQIDTILRGEQDWKKLRHEAASSYKVMSAVLLMQRQQQGKESKPHHFSNEARLINWALSGEFKSIDREALSIDDLDALAKLEERNSVLIGLNIDYDMRKTLLEKFAQELKQPKLN